MNRRLAALIPTIALVAACQGTPADDAAQAPAPAATGATAEGQTPPSAQTLATGEDGRPFTVAEAAAFDEPWAMTFLPDGRALVTQRTGTLHLVDVGTGQVMDVAGVPEVVHAGQGGLGDIVLTPTHDQDQTVYLTWVESGDGGTGAVLGRATLVTDPEPRLDGLERLWTQEPKVSGNGHFSHRVAVSPDGQHLFISSGDRQQMDPAQDLSSGLGKIMRLTTDGAPAPGNPFADRGGVAEQIWSYGHRNPLGLAFDEAGNLWSSEMGPRGGDELNLISEGGNYGWPQASEGDHYDGTDIPDHTEGDGFVAPRASWVPAISPANLMIYTGDLFGPWTGDAFLGGLSGETLVRVDLDGENATVADQWDMDQRIREVEQGPDGSIWLLEDTPGGRLLHLTPVS